MLRLPVHHGDWVSWCWRRRYLSWSWRGSPTATPATFSCSAPPRHLLTGLQGLLLPHPGGQLIHQPPCRVRVMVSWRSRPDWAADRDGWYPLRSGVSNDQTEKEKKKLPRICPVITEQRAASICCLKQPSALGLLAALGEGSKVIFPYLWPQASNVQLPGRSSRWQYILTSAALLQRRTYCRQLSLFMTPCN